MSQFADTYTRAYKTKDWHRKKHQTQKWTFTNTLVNRQRHQTWVRTKEKRMKRKAEGSSIQFNGIRQIQKNSSLVEGINGRCARPIVFPVSSSLVYPSALLVTGASFSLLSHSSRSVITLCLNLLYQPKDSHGHWYSFWYMCL